MKNLFSLFLAFLSGVVLFSGCTQKTDSHIQQQILRVALFDNPTNLDPRTYSDVASFKVIEQVYDFLLRMDSTGLPQPQLAERWENPSDTVFIFTLHKNVRFHDGHPLTAYDVAYTFQSILDPALKAPLRQSMEIVRKITVLDSFRVKFTVRRPHAPFLSQLEVGIVPAHLVREGKIDLKRHPVGSGPFIFVKWVSDEQIVLERNPTYWQGAPRLRRIEMKILPEATTRILALENGEVDFLMNNFPENYLARLQKNPRLKIMKKTGSNYVYLGLNLRNPYLRSRKVRQAIAHAINVPEMIKDLLAGVHTPARSLLSPGHWAYRPSLETYPYNPALARRLLDEAGFTDPDGPGSQPRFSLVYKCSDKLQSRQKAQVIQQYLKAVGIEVNIQSYEWGTFFDDIQNGRFDLFSLTWVGIYEPDIYYRLFHSNSIEGGANRVAYQNPEVDRLILYAQKTLDFQRRKLAYWRIQEILNNDLPYIHLWHETNIAVMDKRLKGFKLYPAGEWKAFQEMYYQNLE